MSEFMQAFVSAFVTQVVLHVEHKEHYDWGTTCTTGKVVEVELKCTGPSFGVVRQEVYVTIDDQQGLWIRLAMWDIVSVTVVNELSEAHSEACDCLFG